MRTRITKLFRPLIGFTALFLSFALIACSSQQDANLRNPDDGPYNPKPTPPDIAAKRKAHSETLAALALSQLNWSKQAIWLSLGVDPYEFTRCMEKSEAQTGQQITRTLTTRGRSCNSQKTVVDGSLKIVTDYREAVVGGETNLWPTRIELTKQGPFLSAQTKYNNRYEGDLDIIELSVTLTELESASYELKQKMIVRSRRDSATKDVRGLLEIEVAGHLSSADFFQDVFVFTAPRTTVKADLASTGRGGKTFSSFIQITESAARGSFPLQKGLPQGQLAIVQSYNDGNKSKDFDGNVDVQGQRVVSSINQRAKSLPGFAANANIAEQFRLIEDLIRDIERTHFGAPTTRENSEEESEETSEEDSEENRNSGAAAVRRI